MKETIRTYEVSKTIVNEDTEKDRFSLDYDEDLKRWVYHAPNAQLHTVEQLQIIVDKLKELNEGGCV